jgi:hypothetical protein
VEEPQHRRDWNPATSQPGEIYTAEGKIAGAGAFARGLFDDDPRAKAYRRSALVTALGWLAAGVIVMFVAIMLFVLL